MLPRLDAEPELLRHAELTRVSDSPFRSEHPGCPKDGVLFVRRDEETLKLLREDTCIGCGQRVIYLDDNINGEELSERS